VISKRDRVFGPDVRNTFVRYIAAGRRSSEKTLELRLSCANSSQTLDDV